jgi:hypothetical protein
MQNNCTTSDRFKRFVFQRCRLLLAVNVKKKYSANMRHCTVVKRLRDDSVSNYLAYASSRLWFLVIKFSVSDSLELSAPLVSSVSFRCFFRSQWCDIRGKRTRKPVNRSAWWSLTAGESPGERPPCTVFDAVSEQPWGSHTADGFRLAAK